MDEVEEDILRFALMLRANDPEQRKRGCNGLQAIAEERQGTPYGKKAREIIDSHCHPRIEMDPELSAFTERWFSIHRLTDFNLPIVLRELQTKPAVAARLRREIIKDLRQWISEALPRVTPQTSPDELDALNKFAALPSLTAYEGELDELKQMRNGLFELRYEKARRKIVNALSTWSFDEAWSAVQQLANPPAGFAHEVTQLQDEIYKATRKHQEVERLLDQSLPPEPARWTEAASVINHVQELSGYLTQQVPEQWRQRLGAAKEERVASVVRFLQVNAMKLREFHELKTFQTDFENLRIDNRDTGIALRKEWFQSALDLLTRSVEKEVTEADTPEALDVILMSLMDKQAGLPDVFVEELNAWRIRLDEISASWRVIRIGDEFPVRMPASEPLPKAFIRAEKFFKKRLQRVKEALARLETSANDAIQTFMEGSEIAREILAELGNHVTALKLKEKAERKIAYYQIQTAITEWQIDQLLELCRPRKEEAESGYYLANADRLRRLQELTSENNFSGSQEAAGWWQLWRARTGDLPANVPDALTRALSSEEQNRADQWHAVLGTLSESPLSPEKYEEIAGSLKHELTRLDLKWRQTTFLHKAAAGYAERFIKAKQWHGAEEKIAELDQEHETTRWLKTLLAVEKARDTGGLALSQVLKSEWFHVSLYLKDDAFRILTAAVVKAWEDKDDEALKNLRMVVSRLLTTHQAPPESLNTFEQWEEWLTVESYVHTTGGLAAIKKLISYLQTQAPKDPLAAQRLERLISYWQEQNDLVMLAWAYEAFRDHVSLPIQLPLEDFTSQHSKLAADYENDLRDNDQLDLANLKSMQAGFKQAENELARLIAYLNDLPHTTTAIKFPPRFYQVKELVSRVVEVWTDLDQLKHADLRLDSERRKLDECRQKLQGDFNGIALRAKLLKREEELQPLTGVPFLQNRIIDAADACGDDEKWDEKGLFQQLVDRLHAMIVLFRRVGAEDEYLWRLISTEYGITVHARSGSLLPRPSPPDVAVLAGQFAELQTEEDRLAQLWRELKNSKPIIPSRSAFEPESHLDYLKRFPKDPPHSRRAYMQFKRNFESIEPMPTILSQSRDYLPEWICKYLDEGIPQYAPEV